MIGSSLLALAATAVVGVLLGLERVSGSDSLFDAGALPQLFAGFRIGLVFGVLAPLLLGVALAVVPLQLGARSLAFPKLAAAGFWTWLSGLVLVIISLADNGGPGGGNAKMVDLFLAAHVLLVVGLAAISLALATTILTTRAPGMRLGRVPFFSWSVLVAADRAAAVAAGPRRRAHLPLRRPPARPDAVRRERRHRLVDRVRHDPAGDVPVRPAGHRHHRRADPGDVPPADADARRHVRRDRPRRRRRACRRSRSRRSTTCRGPGRPATTSRTSCPTPSSRCCRCSAS